MSASTSSASSTSASGSATAAEPEQVTYSVPVGPNPFLLPLCVLANRKHFHAAAAYHEKKGDRKVYTLSDGRLFLGPPASEVEQRAKEEKEIKNMEEVLRAAADGARHAALDELTSHFVDMILEDKALSSAEKYCCFRFLLVDEMNRKQQEIAAHRRSPKKFAPPFYPLALDKATPTILSARVKVLAELEGLRCIRIPVLGGEKNPIAIEVFVPPLDSCVALATLLHLDTDKSLACLAGIAVRGSDDITTGCSALVRDEATYSYLHSVFLYVYGVLAAGLGRKDFPLNAIECVAALETMARRFVYSLHVSQVYMKAERDDAEMKRAMQQITYTIEAGREGLCDRLRALHVPLGETETVVDKKTSAPAATESVKE